MDTIARLCGLLFCFQPVMLKCQSSAPKTHRIPNVVIDCGKSEAHFYNTSNGETGRISHDQLLNLDVPGLANNSLVVIEEAHLRSREEYSLAQPFTYEQLIQLDANCKARNIELRLFPQKVTPKARSIANLKDKSDVNDVVAIATYLENHPNAASTLKRFRPTSLAEFQSQRQSEWRDRQQLSQDINAARNREYTGDYVYDWIVDNTHKLHSTLSEELQQMLEMRVVHKGKPKEKVVFNLGRLYTVVCTLLRPDGSLRLRSDVGMVPYWKYAKKVYFAMTPYHMRGGVVASNVKHHWRRASSDFRKITSEKPLTVDELEEFSYARSEFDKKLRLLWNIVRELVLSTHNTTNAHN